MTEKRPLILISNDDGVTSRGLDHLIHIATGLAADVIVVAPALPQSAKSSALTADAPLMLSQHPERYGARIYSVTGTPVDCVKIAMHAVLDRKPDLLLSGINHGSNAAVNNIYSGTMGATMEGCILAIPSIGYSLLSHSPAADFDGTTGFITDLTKRILHRGLPAGVCLNVNFPADCTPSGIKVVRAARGHWSEEYTDYVTPHGKPFFWLTGKFTNEEPDCPDTDEYWLARKYATIVPIRPDQTAIDCIEEVKSMMEE